MHKSRTLLTLAAIVVTVTGSSAQAPPVKVEVRKDWVDMKDAMVKISNEMPEDKFSFKATPPQRSYGEQILHVAGANVNFLKGLGAKTPVPTIDLKATAKADIVKALAESFDYGTAIIDEQTPESILQTVKAPFIGESTRGRVFYFLLGHTWDIYGQMVVYLRLNGHVPPASQRP